MSVISLSISKKLEKSECLRYHFHIERKRGITDGYYLTRTSISELYDVEVHEKGDYTYLLFYNEEKEKV
ncbi:hypothetical protein K8353_50205, partial [Burkholderia contaminans]|nr:hypothetical protein [Burkholderia contaminans]